MSELDDLLAGAKGTLANAQQLSDTSGLSAIEAEQAKNQAAFEQHKSDQGLSNPVSRFVKGAWSQSIVNPSNWGGALSSILHPVKNIIEPSAEAFKRSVEAPDTATKATELMRSIPVVGNPTVNATNKIINGDVAGGLGELTGEVSNFPVGEAAVKAIPGATSAVGRGTSAFGRGAQTAAEKIFNAKIDPLSASALEVVTGHPYAAAATVATPYALKYGGQLAEKAGNALEGLGTKMKNVGTPAEAPTGMQYPESWKPFIQREQTSPGSSGWTTESGMRSPISREIPMEPSGGWDSTETSAQPTTPSDSGINNSPSMQGLRQAVQDYRNSKTVEAMTTPSTVSSYDRPEVPFSNEALQWLQAHTPTTEPIPTGGAPEGTFSIGPGRTSNYSGLPNLPSHAEDMAQTWANLPADAGAIGSPYTYFPSLAALARNP